MEGQKQYDDEIDLSVYLKIIVKRKKMIITIFLAAVIGTATLCSLMPRIYQTTALIFISPSNIDKYLNELKPSSDISTANPKSALALATHKMLLTSNAVFERVINKLNLTDKEGQRLHVEDLLKKMTVKEEEQTNIFQLSARDKDPVVSMNLANIWAKEYIQYSDEFITGEVQGTNDFLADQFTYAQKNFYDSERKLADFKDQYKIDLMQAELDIKKGKLNGYKTDFLTLGTDIKTQEDLLKELKARIENQDQFIVTSKAITDDALWQESAQGKNPGDFDKMNLKSESVNPIYEDLKSRIINTETELNTNRSKVEYLRGLILSTENDINDLEKIFDQKQIEFDQLTRDIDICKKTYDNLSAKIEEMQMAKAAELGDVKLVSPAFQPERPISRHILKNMALAGFAALVLGVFLAFIKESLEKF